MLPANRSAVAARARRCQWPGSRRVFVATRGLTVELEDPSYASMGTGCRASDHLWSSDDARSESFERSNMLPQRSLVNARGRMVRFEGSATAKLHRSRSRSGRFLLPAYGHARALAKARSSVVLPGLSRALRRRRACRQAAQQNG